MPATIEAPGLTVAPAAAANRVTDPPIHATLENGELVLRLPVKPVGSASGKSIVLCSERFRATDLTVQVGPANGAVEICVNAFVKLPKQPK